MGNYLMFLKKIKLLKNLMNVFKLKIHLLQIKEKLQLIYIIMQDLN